DRSRLGHPPPARSRVILHGKPVQERVLAEVKAGVDRLKQASVVTPTLGVVLIGEDPASQIYVRNKKRAADSVGIVSRDCLYPQGITQRELNALLRALSADPAIHGILLQLPLPKGLDETVALAAIDPEKDVDGLHPTNLGRLLAGEAGTVPCTPAGCLEILDHYGAKLEGAEAVVVGRSRLVGKPLADGRVSPASGRTSERAVWSVSELSRRLAATLDERFPAVWVEGEISNFKVYGSGHAYFTLKDEGAQLRAVLFRNRVRRIRF